MRRALTATLIAVLLAACGPPRAPTLADRLGSLPAPSANPPETSEPGEPDLSASVGTNAQASLAALETAVTNYRAYLHSAPRHDPNRIRIRRRVADLLVELNQARMTAGQRPRDQELREAISIYREAFRETNSAEDRERILYQLARAYVDTGQEDKALETWRQLAREYPGSRLTAETEFRRAEMLFDRGEFERAAEAYGQALERLDPSSPMALQATYKRGWSLLRTGQLQASVAQQLALLDRALPPDISDLEDLASLSGGERKRIEDALDALARAWAQMPTADPIGQQLGGRARPDELLLYESYAAFLLDKERFTDAAEVYGAFARRHPEHPKAPLLAARVVETFEQAGFENKAQEARIDFVDRYAPDGEYWRRTGRTPDTRISQVARSQLLKLAQDYHALSQREGQAADDTARKAIRWYRRFLTAYDSDAERYRINFLLGELLYEQRRFAEAAEAYEQTAYRLPANPKGQEAAYAALQAWERQLDNASETERARIRRQLVNSSRQLTQAYPDHPHRGEVLVRAAQVSLLLDEPGGARDLASQAITQPSLTAEQTRNAWAVRADGAFAMADYAAAERAYGRALQATSRDREHDVYQRLIERRAAAAYKQGEITLAANRPIEAAAHFQRAARVATGAMDIIPVAQYDAAAAYISAGRPLQAIGLLEDLRRQFPEHKLTDDAERRLVKLYEDSGQPAKAAALIEHLYAEGSAGEPPKKADMLWTAAGLYRQAGEDQAAIKALERYLRANDIAFEAAIEARSQLIALHEGIGDGKGTDQWRRRLIDAEQRGGARRTERTRLLAARATIAMAEAKREAYERVHLTHPLQRSLKAKKERMESSLSAYESAVRYGIAETATQATYRMASLYQNFAKALLDSERPSGLSAQALAEYQIMLEDQAFAFEDKAIELHAINAKRTAEGIYNEWVARSFEQLAKMFPARYAKNEEHAILERPI